MWAIDLISRVPTLKFYLSENKFPPNLSSLALYPLRLLNIEFSYDEGFGSLLGSPMNGVVMWHILRQHEHLNDRFLFWPIQAYLIFLRSALLCLTDVAFFLQSEGQTLHQQKRLQPTLLQHSLYYSGLEQKLQYLRSTCNLPISPLSYLRLFRWKSLYICGFLTWLVLWITSEHLEQNKTTHIQDLLSPKPEMYSVMCIF